MDKRITLLIIVAIALFFLAVYFSDKRTKQISYYYYLPLHFEVNPITYTIEGNSNVIGNNNSIEFQNVERCI